MVGVLIILIVILAVVKSRREKQEGRPRFDYLTDVRPGVRKFALWGLGLLMLWIAGVFVAEYWQAMLGVSLMGLYYVGIVVGVLAGLYFLVRFVKWSWYRG